MLEKIKDLYAESLQTQIAAAELLPDKIQQAAQNMVSCLVNGHKIIVCGHGRSHINAQLLVANLLNRYEVERPSFPAVLLSLESAVGSAIIVDNEPNNLYQRQFNAVVQQGDILVVFSPYGTEEVILNLIHTAASKDIMVIALTSSHNDHIQGLLADEDVEIAPPTSKESRILENHTFIINLLCELIDHGILFATP